MASPKELYVSVAAARWLVLELGRDWLNSKAERRTMSGAHEDADLVHDFVLFAITKGVRGVRAASALMDAGYYEDAAVAARTGYEAYLHASFILAQPDRIHDVVSGRLGAYTGQFKHPLTKAGRPKWQTVIDPATGLEYSNGIPVPELVMGTRHSGDRAVHGQLYAFLSEYAHVHMITLGSYVTPGYERFVCEPSPSDPYTTNLFISYVAWLLVSELAGSGEVEHFDLEEEGDIAVLGDALIEAMPADVDKPLAGLPQAMVLRLAPEQGPRGLDA